jgi:hypothetical protein
METEASIRIGYTASWKEAIRQASVNGNSSITAPPDHASASADACLFEMLCVSIIDHGLLP